MTYSQTISVNNEIARNPEFWKLKEQRKLSPLINALLENHFKITSETE